MGREKPIQSGCMRELRKWGAMPLNVKGGPTTPTGWPDIVACWHGLYLAVEVKQPGGVLSNLQRHRLAMLQMAGAKVLVVESVADLRSWLQQLQAELAPPSQYYGHTA